VDDDDDDDEEEEDDDDDGKGLLFSNREETGAGFGASFLNPGGNGPRLRPFPAAGARPRLGLATSSIALSSNTVSSRSPTISNFLFFVAGSAEVSLIPAENTTTATLDGSGAAACPSTCCGCGFLGFRPFFLGTLTRSPLGEEVVLTMMTSFLALVLPGGPGLALASLLASLLALVLLGGLPLLAPIGVV